MDKPQRIKRTSPKARRTQAQIIGARIATKLWRIKKRCYWLAGQVESTDVRSIFIFGCQRSGTALISNIIDRDISTDVLHENSRLTQPSPEHLRLKSMPEVKRLLANSRAGLVCAKPLVESQHAKSWLDELEDLHAIWLTRNHNDLIMSHLRRFQSQIANIAAIVDEEANNWRNENISDDLRDLIKEHYDPTMSRADAAALHWYIRNSFLFSQGLDQHPRVHVLDYDVFVTDAKAYMHHLYELIGRKTSNIPHMCKIADTNSIGSGDRVALSPAIENLCSQMADQLRNAFENGSFRDVCKRKVVSS